MRVAERREASRGALGAIRTAGAPAIHAGVLLLVAGLAAAAAACGSRGSPFAGPDRARLSAVDRAVHLLNRASYGATPADVREVLDMGIDAWLDRQTRPHRIDDSGLALRLDRAAQALSNSRFAPLAMARADELRARAERLEAELARAEEIGAPSAEIARLRLEAHKAEMEVAGLRFAAYVMRTASPDYLSIAKLVRAVHTERQLEEVMTDFWFNHFNINVEKSWMLPWVLADYESTAIRANVFGRFEDMLIATARHPAMLIYLDNWLSVAPREGQDGGLNENYARELLELHTLGVDGGYTQSDVVEIARAFTGWGIARSPRGTDSPETGSPAIFRFRADLHDMGDKVVLGRDLPAGRGMEDGMDVLRMLARHPSTARHIATKLVRHFVSDNPPPALVKELERVFNQTDGDLRAVTIALFTADAFYDPAHFRSKIKRPFEYAASALRVTGAELERPAELLRWLERLGHVPYAAPEPAGYPTTQADWVSASAVLSRVNFAVELARGGGTGARFEIDSMLGDVAPAVRELTASGAGSQASPRESRARVGRPLIRAISDEIARRILPGSHGPALAMTLNESLDGVTRGTLRPLIADAVGLGLGSPVFQRH